MKNTQTARPPTSAAAANFPEIIPEPQIVVLTGDTVQRPDGITLTEVPEEASDIAGQFARRVGVGNYRVSLEMDSNLAPSQAPEAAWPEAYALEVGPDAAHLRARTVSGLQWGLQTLNSILHAIPTPGGIPSASITDWPTMATRGIFVENKWGPDLMELEDWKYVIDYLAERKMNALGIGLYGCWCVQYDGQITEFMMTPLPGYPELQTPKTIRWYSPAHDRWEELTYLPRIFEQDFLSEIVAYGQQRGVTVFPFVNSLGHNTLIPRLCPEFSARDAQGNPRGTGYCLSNPETRKFVTQWYQHICEHYFKPYGVDIFHIQMDEVWEDFCECPNCRQQPREKMLQEWAITLVKHLVDCGVSHVVMYNDQFTRHMQALDETFIQRLREEDLLDKLIVDWWGYSNTAIRPGDHPRLGQGLRAWVKPMTCYYNWSRYQPYQHNVALVLEMGHAEGAEGANSYSVFDPAWGLDFDILAEYAWNFRGAGPVHRFEEKWARVRGDGAVLEAVRWLDRAAPLAQPLAYYDYTYPNPEQPYPRHYPEEPLEQLTDKSSDLQFIAEAASRARRLIDGRTDELSRNLLAEAARMEGLAVVFQRLRQVRASIYSLAEPGGASQVSGTGALAGDVREAQAVLAEMMGIIESNKPPYMVPSCLRDLSVLYEFLGQLSDDIDEAGRGERAWSDVRWFVEGCVAQRGFAKKG